MDMPWAISPVTVESCALPPVAAASARVRAQSHWQGKGAAAPPEPGMLSLSQMEKTKLRLDHKVLL